MYYSLFRVTFSLYICVFFFFQAEDGIRDGTVTGVQTCALPIWAVRNARWSKFMVQQTVFRAISTLGDGPLHEKRDRKSTRLNSSHSSISYAVFCLKKKKKKKKKNKSN